MTKITMEVPDAYFQLRTLLKKEGIEYSDDQLEMIENFLDQLVDISIRYYHRMKDQSAKIISLTSNNSNETTCISLQQGEYRRAS